MNKMTIKKISAPTAMGLALTVRRAALLLLTMMLTTATGWAQIPGRVMVNITGNGTVDITHCEGTETNISSGWEKLVYGSFTLTMTPGNGYTLQELQRTQMFGGSGTVSTTETNGVFTYTGSETSNVTYTVVFAEAGTPSYALIGSVDRNAATMTFSVGGEPVTTAEEGDDVYVTLSEEPDDSWKWQLTSDDVESFAPVANSNTQFHFTMPAKSVTVRAGLVRAYYTIIDNSTQGWVSWSSNGTGNLLGGETVTLTPSGMDGYKVETLSAMNRTTDEAIALTDNHDGTWTFTMPESDVTVTATFSYQDYTITYHPNGGTMPDGYLTTYNLGTPDITLPTPTPTLTDYTFGGWYTNEALTGDAVTVIKHRSFGDREYWAKWCKLLTHADIAISDIPAQKYNGTALIPAPTITDGQKVLAQGTDFTVSPETLTDVGSYTVTITGIGNYSGTATKTFTINRRVMTLTSASNSKTYDGTPLTDNLVTYVGDGFAQGEGATYSVTGTQTDAGSSANTFTYTLNYGTKAANYDITTAFGTLTVTPASVTLTSATDEKTYDGTALTADGVTVGGDGFAQGEGATYSVTGTQTDAGSSANTFTYTLNDGTKAANYDITTAFGTLTVSYVAATLADNADNTDAIADIITNYGSKANVTLQGRTLYKDGKWNTLVLPFAVSDFTGTPLEDAVVKTLVSSGFEDGTLTMNFSNDLTSIAAGVPYIVKWTSGTDIKNPVFSGVTVSSTTANVSTTNVDFIGTYSPVGIYEDGTAKHNLYLGADNTLYYPTTEDFTVNACRAYFRLQGDLTAGEPAALVRAFTLNFGEGDASGIVSISKESGSEGVSDTWYTLDGRRLSGKPAKSSIYVNNGRKVIIK